MSGGISIDSYTGSLDGSTVGTATAVSHASEVDPASHAPAGGHAGQRTHSPDTSADLTRNWLTATAPPQFSRRGVGEVVMPVRAGGRGVEREGGERTGTRTRAQSASRAQEGEEGRRGRYGGHRRAETGGASIVGMSTPGGEERTFGWVGLGRTLSSRSSRGRTGLGERRKEGEGGRDEEDEGRVTREGEGDYVEGKKLMRKWPWESFLKIVDKRLGKKGRQ